MQNQPSQAREVKFCRLNLAPEFPVELMQGDKWYSPYQAITMVHFHNCLQVGYCYEGQGYSLIDGVLYPYCTETVSLIPAKALHFCTSQRNVVSRWKWLYLDPIGLLPRMSHGQEQALMAVLYGKTPVPCTVTWGEAPQMVEIVRCMIRELEERGKGYKDAVRGLGQAFVAVLLRMARAGMQQEERPGAGARGNNLQIIAPAIEHISMCYMEPLTVPQLAQLCHISPTHLRRMFQKIMECSPLDYLQLTRVEAACALLMHTDTSVLEVGSRAGFATPTSFTRQFKKTFGMTPGKWRARMMGAESE